MKCSKFRFVRTAMAMAATAFLLFPSLLWAQSPSRQQVALNETLVWQFEALLDGKEINEFSAVKYFTMIGETGRLREEKNPKSWSLYVAKGTLDCSELESGLTFTRYYFYSLDQRARNYLAAKTQFKEITSLETLEKAFSYPVSAGFYVAEGSYPMQYTVALNSKSQTWSVMGSTSQEFDDGSHYLGGRRAYCAHLKEASQLVLKTIGTEGSYGFLREKDGADFLLLDLGSLDSRASSFKVSRIIAYPDRAARQWKTVTAINEFKK